ncbi:hypothetical protein [Nocardia asiatica]|uniref:hypothetical protein n=1 Tax=Nocardia asiatica TaxID=209252 RepID=UPI0003163A61|nr:hypothetical protein [Nocardia asiatica]
MTSPASISAQAILFRNAAHDAGVGELAECLRERGIEHLALRRVPGAAAILRSAALREVAETIHGLLEIDLGSVAIGGWRRYDRLRRAAIRTRSGGVEQVTLAEHEITHSCRPSLDVTVDGNPVGEFAVEICVAILLEPLTSTVRDGTLVALGPGNCTVTVSIGTPELGPIMKRERTLRTATMIDLRWPIPLVERPAAPPAPLPAGRGPGVRPPRTRWTAG